MKNSIQQYCSFEEMENTQLNYFASLDPEIHLQLLKSLVLNAYGYKEDLLLNRMDHIIHFNTKE
jgi:hypothetical protein